MVKTADATSTVTRATETLADRPVESAAATPLVTPLRPSTPRDKPPLVIAPPTSRPARAFGIDLEPVNRAIARAIAGNVGSAPPSPGTYVVRDGGQERHLTASLIDAHDLAPVPLDGLAYAYALRDEDQAYQGMLFDLGGTTYFAKRAALYGMERAGYLRSQYENARATISKGLAGQSDVVSAKVSINGYAIALDDGTRLAYDEKATFASYNASHQSLLSLQDRLNEHGLRIPERMYELLTDPAFTAARDAKRYSEMYDRIFAKAREVTNGDVRQALLVSLLTTDLRERGPAGAIHGTRGQRLVPLSIFDNEDPTGSVIGNRYDAAQHFFGYALLAYDAGASASAIISTVSKAELARSFGRFTRNLHFGRDPDFGADKIVSPFGPAQYITPIDADWRLRPRYDHLADLHYNNMGIAMATALRTDPTTTPSSVINRPDWENERRAFELPADRSQPWSVTPREALIRGAVDVHAANNGTRRVLVALNYGYKSPDDDTPVHRLNDHLTIPYDQISELTYVPLLDGKPRPDLVAVQHYDSYALVAGADTDRFVSQRDMRFLVGHRGYTYVLSTDVSMDAGLGPDGH